jgi:2-amino-4-hydroxy-6-hydroxymethyldihydropteridine diphosphokinase
MHTAYIGIGSNQGDRLSYCREALRLLGQREGIDVSNVSRWYESDALLDHSPSDQPPYINAAARLNTSLSPESLISVLIAVEASLGRPHPRPRGEPRTIDLDLLLYDDLVIDTPALTIPHPQMTKRMFVLAPMCDIAPHLIHPLTGHSLSQLRAALGVAPGRVELWSAGGCRRSVT